LCIFPARFNSYLSKYGFDKSFEIMYVYPSKRDNKITKIDFTKQVPPYQNVINVAIYAAIYMGFKEIYLLGCDMTCVVTVYEEDDDISYGGHFFEDDHPKEIERLKQLHRSRSNEFMLKAYGYVFELFRKTLDYAIEHKIKIYNVGRGGALDVFPKLRYEDLFVEQDSKYSKEN